MKADSRCHHDIGRGKRRNFSSANLNENLGAEIFSFKGMLICGVLKKKKGTKELIYKTGIDSQT